MESLTNIFTLTNSLLMWKDVKKYLAIPNKLLTQSGSSRTHTEHTLLTWRLRGVLKFGHLFDNSQLKSFQSLRQEFNLPSNDFL